MFPAAYALRPGALLADYNAHVGQIALSEYLAQLDNGEDQYFVALRKMALHLYDAFLTKHNAEVFLDKTSRYYLILPELVRTFPEAKYVFLVRNPLAVLASFLNTMVNDSPYGLSEPGVRKDLLEGYKLIRQGIEQVGDDAIVINYEELVGEPEATIALLCKRLKIPFEPEMLNYGKKLGVLPGKLVDPKSIHKHDTPVKDYVDAWQSLFVTSQERYIAQVFLTHLGPELVNSFGYSYQDLYATVPFDENRWAPVAKWDVLMTPRDQRNYLKSCKIAIAYIFHTWQKEFINSNGIDSISNFYRFVRRIASRAIHSVFQGS